MSYRIDADGFRVPSAPASSLRSSQIPSGSAPPGSSTSSTKTRLVALANYRSINLSINRIYVRKVYEEFPEHIKNFIHKAGRDRESPGPSLDQIRLDADLQSLWVATNQCVGDSVACVNLLERINDRLKLIGNEHVQLLETAAFSIAMSGTEARLYITWKQDDSYYMQKVRGFLLQDPEHYQLFYKYVHNIVDWGRGERLDGIRKAFDALQEFDREQASREAKARTPPSPEPTSSQRLREEE
ncbi:hypothetical protein CJF30_00002296 [Rutstroemia sp. NJR-2017a BBW]|nr:hypothetical protein CJF30_00002296 [Rutstroemia sp. NJR-2017a BBW]